MNVVNESLYLAIGGVLLGLVAWAFSKIFDRSQSDIAALQIQVSDLRHATRNKHQEFDYRIRALEEAGGPPSNRRGNPRAA